MIVSQTPPPESAFGPLHDVLDSSALRLALAGLLACVVVFWIGSVVWVWKDARRRLDDPWLVAVAVVVAVVLPFVGLLLYASFRPPDYLDVARERSLEMELLASRLAPRGRRCPACRTQVEPGFLVCPVCTRRLRRPCASCGAPLEPLWQACPHCLAPVHARRPEPAAAESA